MIRAFFGGTFADNSGLARWKWGFGVEGVGLIWVRFGFDCGALWCAAVRGVGTFADIRGRGMHGRGRAGEGAGCAKGDMHGLEARVTG